MLIDKILLDVKLQKYICGECDENGVGITIHPSVDRKELVIIKADAYLKYELHPNPAGPDCLIIQHCADDSYRIFLIELKNIADLGLYSLTHIRDKFQNCFDIIMSDKHRELFYNLNYRFKSILLIFISNPKEQLRREGIDKKQKNTRLDSLLALRPCQFANKHYPISYLEPYPTIIPC
jgi:hypothetical protein